MKKDGTAKKRLTLRRESVRELKQGELAQANGGATWTTVIVVATVLTDPKPAH